MAGYGHAYGSGLKLKKQEKAQCKKVSSTQKLVPEQSFSRNVFNIENINQKGLPLNRQITPQ